MADTAITGVAAAAQINEPLIRVEGLRKSFGSLEVLKGIDLSVNPGEVVTIIGASGSGKSTFLRCLNLLETPDAGHIWFHGQDLTAERCNINKLREDIGMVFQGFNLFNNMDVLDNCTLAPVTLKKMSKAEAEKVAMEHLTSVGLEKFAHAGPCHISVCGRLFVLEITREELASALVFGVAEELGRRGVLEHHALVHKDHAVGHGSGKGHLVRDDDHGHAVGRKLAHDLEHLSHDLWGSKSSRTPPWVACPVAKSSAWPSRAPCA